MLVHTAAGHRLPQTYTPFIGRQSELAAVARLLETARLLTLTGPGGCGKTRLALQLCRDPAVQQRFADGVVWCDLASISDPANVALRLAAEFGLSEQPDRPIADTIAEAVAPRHALIVLDNCEHVLSACAALADALSHQAPDITLLATSLQRLGLPQETVWPVPPLSVPRPEYASDWPQSDAVRLFVERAQLAAPSFALQADDAAVVAAICRRLDGMPLAIELAAARVRLLSPAQILERLDRAFELLARGLTDGLPRHQTLRATMDWSYGLLDEVQRCLLRRLSVFAGPFTLEMIEAICAERLEPSALDVLTDLVDRSLVAVHERDEQGGTRFRLLETVRQYAREKLEQSGESGPLRARYLEWCVAWAELSEPNLARADRGAWVKRFESQQGHFRVSLRWACTSRQAEPGLRLANALIRFWLSGGMAEGRAWFEELLSLETRLRESGDARVPDRTRARALFGLGRLAVRVGDHEVAARRGAESLDLFRACGDPAGVLDALNLLALAAQDANDYVRAIALYAEALDLSRRTGNARMSGVVLVNQGLLYYEQQDYRRAAPLWAEAQAIAERLGYSKTYDNLACLAMMQGEFTRAEQLLQQQLQIDRDSGAQLDVALTLMDIGENARRQGELDRAETLLTDALERHRQMSNSGRIGETLVYLGHVARNRGQIEVARQCYEQSLPYLEQSHYTRYLSHVHTALGVLAAVRGSDDDALRLLREGLRIAQRGHHHLCRVEVLEEMAGLWARHDKTREAARLLAVAAAERDRLGAPVPPVERARYDERVNDLYAALGRDAMGVLQSHARDVSPDQVAAELLGEPRVAETPALVAAPRPPDLTIYALGPTRVLVGERALSGGDWTYNKSKELFFYLLLNRPTSKAQIGLDLWRDASPDQLRNMFHRTLHYLRKALGHGDWIAYADGRYSFSPALNLWCDVREFESSLAGIQPWQTHADVPADTRAGLRTVLERATQLWRGDLLADLDVGDWAVLRRESLRRAYTQALMDLGALHLADARYADAVAVYRRVLAQDEYFEAAHRELMRCFARLGESSQALRHFQSLRTLLRDELGAAPSPETLLLYERLRRGDDV